jgi:hypothetical protein
VVIPEISKTTVRQVVATAAERRRVSLEQITNTECASIINATLARALPEQVCDSPTAAGQLSLILPDLELKAGRGERPARG